MATMTPIELGSTLRLTLLVDRAGLGPVTGLHPQVAIRHGSTPGAWLDWAGLLFRTSGWTQMRATLAEVDATNAPGVYELALNTALIVGASSGLEFVAEFYESESTPGITLRASERYVARETVSQLEWVHAVHHNRQEAEPGTPGALRVYRADGVTVWKTAQLRDYTGAGVGGTTGLPARRTGFS